MDNQSGRTFANAKIKLMAGDLGKLKPDAESRTAYAARGGGADAAPKPPVSEQAFDEYHLYTLARPTTLRDRETMQVELVRATE